MSKKYQVTGPDGEVIGIHFREKDGTLMAGGRLKFKPFLDHICFTVLGLCGADVTSEGKRQQHKYRYHFDVDSDYILQKFYSLRERYKVEEIGSIIRIT